MVFACFAVKQGYPHEMGYQRKCSLLRTWSFIAGFEGKVREEEFVTVIAPSSASKSPHQLSPRNAFSHQREFFSVCVMSQTRSANLQYRPLSARGKACPPKSTTRPLFPYTSMYIMFGTGYNAIRRKNQNALVRRVSWETRASLHEA